MNRLYEMLIEKFGFEKGEDGILSRQWEKETEVVWVGKVTSIYRVKVIPFSKEVAQVECYKNGGLCKRKVYSSGYARTLNAIRETVKCAGFEF